MNDSVLKYSCCCCCFFYAYQWKFRYFFGFGPFGFGAPREVIPFTTMNNHVSLAFFKITCVSQNTGEIFKPNNFNIAVNMSSKFAEGDPGKYICSSLHVSCCIEWKIITDKYLDNFFQEM